MKTIILAVTLTSLLAPLSFAQHRPPTGPRHPRRGGTGNAGTGGNPAPESWTGAQTAVDHAKQQFHSKNYEYGHAKDECAEAGGGMSSDVAERERKKREACDKASAAHGEKTRALTAWRDAAKKAVDFAKNELKNAKDQAAKDSANSHLGWANTQYNDAEHTQ